MKRFLAALGATLSMGLAAPALAGPTGLTVGGLTLGGPAVTTITASATETVLSAAQPVDVCATVMNTGMASVDLTLVGGGSSAVSVPSRKTATHCRQSMQSVTLTCTAVGTGTCSVAWRVDQMQ